MIVDYINEKLGWRIDPDIFSSLYTMILGAKISARKLSERFGIDLKVIQCFAAFVMAPIIEDAKDPGQNRKKSKATTLMMRKSASKLAEEPAADALTRTTNEIELINLDQGITAVIDPKRKPRDSPTVKIIREYLRPNETTMEWLGKKFKLNGMIVYGIYAMLINPTKRHNKCLKEATKEVMRRARIDEKHLQFCFRLTQLIVSRDRKSV
jgi:hypothetical protein